MEEKNPEKAKDIDYAEHNEEIAFARIVEEANHLIIEEPNTLAESSKRSERLEEPEELNKPLLLIPQEKHNSNVTSIKEQVDLSEYLSNLDHLIERHPYFKDREGFVEQYRQAQHYIIIKTLQYNDALLDIPQTELAKRTQVPDSTIYYWLTNQTKTTHLIRNLKAHEKHRLEHETNLTREARECRIDPSDVYNILSPVREYPAREDPELLTLAIANLYKIKENRSKIIFAELYPYHNNGPKWLREIAKVIDIHHPQIEPLLNSFLGFDKNPHEALRIAIIGDDTLYIWRRNTNPNEWINICAQERFAFKTTDYKSKLINEARSYVGLKGDIQFGHLIAKITDYPYMIPTTRHQITDLRRQRPILQGETLHFLLDATKRTLEDVKSYLSYIGTHGSRYGKGRIINPLFPELEPLRTRLYCTIACDGHINEHRHVIYAEKNHDRIEYVKGLFSQLGDIEYSQHVRSGCTYIRYPAIIGRIFEHWGMPIGDKVLQNEGMPGFIIKGTRENKRAYLQELIPEEGNFHPITGFQWSRGVVLDGGNKAAKYNFESKINDDLLEIIQQYGKTEMRSYRRDVKVECKVMNITTIEELRKSQDEKLRKKAERLLDIIYENPNQLLIDEVRLCEELGIDILFGPKKIHFYESGRVSVSWTAQTRRKKGAIEFTRWAPPSDTRKRSEVESWLKRISE